jgi:hypothetical protein
MSGRLDRQRHCSRFRIPRIAAVALILAAMGFSGGCSMFSSPKKQQSSLPYNPWIKPAKEDSKPSWLGSLFSSKKEKPKEVSQWISQDRPGS